MTPPRFQLKITDEDVPNEVLENRARFAQGPLASRMAAKADGSANYSDMLVPETWGAEMFRLHGKNWPAMIGLATGAAMKAEREAIAAADKVGGRG